MNEPATPSSTLVIRSSTAMPFREHLRPAAVWAALAGNRGLIGQFASREVLERHRGAYLGAAWNLVNPLITLAIYTFVFGYVFQSRWETVGANEVAGAEGLATSFVLPFFLGHALFHYFAECVNRAPGTVAGRPNLVKKVVFPVEVLPVAGAVSGLVYPAVSIVCLLVVQVAMTGGVPWTAVLLPLVVLPLVPLCLGAAWALAAIGVYVRDVRHVTAVLTQLAMFMTPVFYPVERIPEAWRGLYMLNPLAVVLEGARAVMLWGRMPDWAGLGAVMLLGLVVMQLGYAVFMRLRRGLSDVI